MNKFVRALCNEICSFFTSKFIKNVFGDRTCPDPLPGPLWIKIEGEGGKRTERDGVITEGKGKE